MSDEVERSPYSFKELDWDTKFFGVSCAKAVIFAPLSEPEWATLLPEVSRFEFVSIENRNSEPSNARRIGTVTQAFLADVNVQFEKKLESDTVSEGVSEGMSERMSEVGHASSVQFYPAMERDEQILNMAIFEHSKFISDPELKKRGGDRVYREWLSNAFGKEDKFFAVAGNESGAVTGYLLYSCSDKICTIELISVSGIVRQAGVGSALFRAVEKDALDRGCDTLRVGTQARNTGAVNFYHKCGCKQIGCHSVYHLWNL